MDSVEWRYVASGRPVSLCQLGSVSALTRYKGDLLLCRVVEIQHRDSSRNRRFRGQGGVKGGGGQLIHRRVLECTDCTEMGCIEFLWLLFLLLYPSVISYQSQDFTTFNTILLLKPLPERTYPPCSDHFFLARDCCNPGQQKPELSSS